MKEIIGLPVEARADINDAIENAARAKSPEEVNLLNLLIAHFRKRSFEAGARLMTINPDDKSGIIRAQIEARLHLETVAWLGEVYQNIDDSIADELEELNLSVEERRMIVGGMSEDGESYVD